MFNPYKDIAKSELIVIRQGLIKTLMKGRDEGTNSTSESDVQVLSSILMSVETELKTRA